MEVSNRYARVYIKYALNLRRSRTRLGRKTPQQDTDREVKGRSRTRLGRKTKSYVNKIV